MALMGLLLGCKQTPRELKKKLRAARYTGLEQDKYLKDGIRWQLICHIVTREGPGRLCRGKSGSQGPHLGRCRGNYCCLV